MEATEARRGYARVAAWDEGNLIQAMARLKNQVGRGGGSGPAAAGGPFRGVGDQRKPRAAACGSGGRCRGNCERVGRTSRTVKP